MTSASRLINSKQRFKSCTAHAVMRSETLAMFILLVDDNRDALEDLRKLIAEHGHEVRTAANKDLALRLLGGGFKPSVIFFDHHAPGINSSVFVATVRVTLPRTQIVLMSALPDIGPVAAQLGVTARLSKPVDRDALNAMLKAFSSGEHAATPSSSSSSLPPPQQPRGTP